MESIRETGFKVFPERKLNYDKQQSAEPMEIPNHQPIMLDIENVSRCNYRCSMCQVSQWEKGKRARDMALDEFKSLLDGQTGLMEIKLQGMGEPFLEESYFDMIKYARSRHLWVRSTTNGSLLHVKNNFKRILDADICEIQVSVDGATEKAYQAIRKGGNFRRIKDNCKLLNRYAADSNLRRTRMWVVVQSTNFNELEQIVLLTDELGFERLTFSLDLNDWGQTKWKQINDSVDMHHNFSIERGCNLVELGIKLGVEVTFWFIDDKYRRSDKTRICPWPFERAYISSDMRVVPCCMIATPDVYDLGDARDLNTVWRSEKMKIFRKMHLSENLPLTCRSCYMDDEN
tara:strand:+ start:127 stop:1161 length:1035 start_codon:yes stop_codon:yes gene_type:complete